MKKTLLLSALVVTATAFAGTTGNFSIKSEHGMGISNKKAATTPIEKKVALIKEFENIAGFVKAEGEVNLGGGVSLGGDVKYVKLNDEVLPTELNTFVKYGFSTSIEGLTGYIKGNVNAVPITKDAHLTATAELGGTYKKDDMKYSYTVKTFLPINKSKIDPVPDPYYTSKVFATVHKFEVEGKKDKLEDVSAFVKYTHGYTKHTAELPILNVTNLLQSEAKGAVKVMDGLKIGVHGKFDTLFNGVDKDDNPFGAFKVDEFILHRNGKSFDDNEVFFANKGDLAALAKLYANYKKDKVEVTGAGIFEHIKENKLVPAEVVKTLYYAASIDGKYEVMENLEIGAKAFFGGKTVLANKDKSADDKAKTNGFVRLESNVKYTANVNDRLTVTPEFVTKFNIEQIKAADTENNKKYSPALRLGLMPKLGVEFKATDSVTLTASSQFDSEFVRSDKELAPADKADKFEYVGTAMKAKLGLKYTW